MKTKKEMIQDRDNAILLAREKLTEPYFVFDTETTGKDKNYDQIVQFAILKSNGKQFKTLVKSTIPVSEEAFAIHNISNDDLETAPFISEVIWAIPVKMNMFAYNVTFDARVLKNSLRASGSGLEIDIDDVNIPCDVMVICAAYRGEWYENYNDYRWRKLDFVCEEFGIDIDCSFHDALSDAILTEKVIKYIAKQKLSTEE